MKKLILISMLVGAGALNLARPVAAQEKNTTKRAKATRTLDDIKIEGEIAVPQVLFITARDFRRYRDGLGSRFRPGATDVARSIDRPTQLRVVAKPKNKEDQE